MTHKTNYLGLLASEFSVLSNASSAKSVGQVGIAEFSILYITVLKLLKTWKMSLPQISGSINPRSISLGTRHMGTN